VPRASIDAEIGRCDETELAAVDGALRRWMELD
jgi:hypothetical protein